MSFLKCCKKLIWAFAGIVCAVSAPLQSECNNLPDPFELEGELEFTFGHRYDKIKTLINIYIPPLVELIESNDLVLNHVHINEIGVSQEVTLCCNWLFQCELRTGNAHSGRYKETDTLLAFPPTSLLGRVYKGTTHDASLGFGYLFTLKNLIQVGPVGGWSYHYQRFQMKHMQENGIPQTNLDKLTYKNHWQGFWIGVEGRIDFCWLLINASYHYTPGRWDAEWVLAGNDVPFFGPYSDERTAPSSEGQEIYLEAAYVFSNPYLSGLRIGLGLNYQYWRARNGREKPQAGSFASIGFPASEIDKVKVALWESYDYKVFLGWEF